MNVGELTPDTAFAEPGQRGLPHEARRTLLITMRGLRAFPSDAWFEGIGNFALKNDLRIMTMSQVDEDEERSRELAARFGSDLASHVEWGENSDFEQEQAIRALYEQCALVISDRLHVLILSAQAGALPVELAPRAAPKVRTHFETIGYRDVSLDTESTTAAAIESFLNGQLGRPDELVAKIDVAREALRVRISDALPAAS